MDNANGYGRAFPVILAVDDQAETRELYALVLGQAGYEVVTVDGCARALETLRFCHFDLLLTDYRLGDGTGLELVQRAERERLLTGTAVVLCTAESGLVVPQGVTVMHKPVPGEALTEVVGACLRGDRRRRTERRGSLPSMAASLR
ncbi:MAG: response regulator [Myxococcales bacterium]|nr:response regulator [Myxococcales bacterium]